jgi:dienelactone hydrolase
MDVMKRAEDMGCDYLGVYATDVLKGTPGQSDFDPAWETALEYGAKALGGVTPPQTSQPLAALAQAPSGEAAAGLAGFHVDGERWTYQDDRLSIKGILLKPEGQGPFPAILISHGLGGSAQTFALNKAREMVKWGLVCMACDYAHAATPGQKLNPQGPERATYGASEENLRRASKCLDLLCAMPEVDSKKLCAYGHSMGGFVTIGLAAKEPDRLVAAAISGSGIAARGGFPAPSAERAAKVKTPFIIFHGSTDNTVRPAQSLAFKEILDQSGVANERHVFDGIGHPVDQQNAPEVLGLMRAWFAKHSIILPGPFTATATTPQAPPSALIAPPPTGKGYRSGYEKGYAGKGQKAH